MGVVIVLGWGPECVWLLVWHGACMIHWLCGILVGGVDGGLGSIAGHVDCWTLLGSLMVHFSDFVEGLSFGEPLLSIRLLIESDRSTWMPLFGTRWGSLPRWTLALTHKSKSLGLLIWNLGLSFLEAAPWGWVVTGPSGSVSPRLLPRRIQRRRKLPTIVNRILVMSPRWSLSRI